MIDEKFFNVLYQLRAVWECGYVNAPNYFASVELFRRSFNELFLCRTLDMSTFGSIDTESDGSDSDESPPKLPEGESPTRLVDFRAVQQCNYLEVYGPNSLWTMTVADVVEWLHGETTKTEWPNKSRCMSVMGGFNDYGPLLEELKKVSKSVCSMQLNIKTAGRDGQTTPVPWRYARCKNPNFGIFWPNFQENYRSNLSKCRQKR